MDGVKEEPPVNEEEDDGRGAWNTVHLGISLFNIFFFSVFYLYTYLFICKYFLYFINR